MKLNVNPFKKKLIFLLTSINEKANQILVKMPVIHRKNIKTNLGKSEDLLDPPFQVELINALRKYIQYDIQYK